MLLRIYEGSNLRVLIMGIRINEIMHPYDKPNPRGYLTHLPLLLHIVNWVSIGSDNGVSPDRRQALSEPMLKYCQLDP